MNKYLLIGIALTAAVLLLLLGVQTHRLDRLSGQHDALSLEFEAYKQAQMAFSKAQELRMANEIEGIRHEAQQEAGRIKSEGEAAYAVALDLHNRVYEQQISRLRATCNAVAAAGGKDAADPIGVLAHVLTRTDEAAGVYARVADERAVALNACISAYEALASKR